jgi:NADPH2:quinone reductase
LTSNRPGRRQRFRGTPIFALSIIGGWLFPGRKRVVPYSIQTLKRMKPAWFRQDLITLLDLLKQTKIQPLVAQRFPFSEARQAHEMLVKGGVVGKIVLVPDDCEMVSQSEAVGAISHMSEASRESA